MKKDEYKCKNCKEIWGFFPEDYEDNSEFPTLCPLCTIPITQMIKDVFKEEGILEVFRMLWLRLT